jgi:nucleoside-diphosphate-sugar epimerase
LSFSGTFGEKDMKVAVTGANGFIGSRFIELYKNEFEIIKLTSSNAPFNSLEKIIYRTKDCDVLVHTAFDHHYKDNIIGITNIFKACKVNNIKKLIHISTVSVYNPDIQGILNESTPYSKINDPYSKEKRKIENEIEKFKDSSIDIIILQPSIVYGLGGNWTKYALHVCKSKALYLPNSGDDICNAIYVYDVAGAIYKSCFSKLKYEKVIISNEEKLTWREFYQKQCEILKELNLPSNCNIENNSFKNEFHSKAIINFIFILWFKTPMGNIFDLMISTLKKIRAKSYKNTSSKDELKKFLQSDISQDFLTPLGITKKVHNCKFVIDTSKAKKLLDFEANISFGDGCNKIKNNIKEILR